MGLLETEIGELRQLVDDVMQDKVSMVKAALQLSIYSQVSKRERLMFDIWKASAKEKSLLKNASSKNLLDSSCAIDCVNLNEDKIVCPERGGALVTRNSCLDFSGTERNLTKCQECCHFSTSRKRELTK